MSPTLVFIILIPVVFVALFFVVVESGGVLAWLPVIAVAVLGYLAISAMTQPPRRTRPTEIGGVPEEQAPARGILSPSPEGLISTIRSALSRPMSKGTVLIVILGVILASFFIALTLLRHMIETLAF